MIAPKGGGSVLRAEGAEAEDASLFEGSLGLLCAAAKGERLADDGAGVAVDDGGQMRPSVLADGDVVQLQGPSLVAARGPARAHLPSV